MTSPSVFMPRAAKVLVASTQLCSVDRQQLLLQSDDPGNAAWTKTLGDFTTASAIANPFNGTVNAKVFTDTVDGSAVQHSIQQLISMSAIPGCGSVTLLDMSAGATPWAAIELGNSAPVVFVNLTTGAFTPTGQATVVAATAARDVFGNLLFPNAAANGWGSAWTITASGIPLAPLNFWIYPALNGTTTVYQGTKTSRFAVWGAQVVYGTAPGPYCPSTAAQINPTGAIRKIISKPTFSTIPHVYSSAGAFKATVANSGAASQFDFTVFQSFAIIGWFLNTAIPSGTQAFIVKGDASTTGYYATITSQHVVAVVNGSGAIAAVSAVGSVLAGSWTHIAVVFDGVGKTITIYTNGVAATTIGTYSTAGLVTSVNALTLGNWSGSSLPLNAGSAIDDIRIYNTTLTAVQIVTDYQGTAIAGYLERWLLEDGSGNTAVASVSSSFNATLTGHVWGAVNSLKRIQDIPSWTSIYDADLGVTLNTTQVSQWNDQGSGAINLTATSTAQPLFVSAGLNGHGTIRFDGSANVMTFASEQPHCMVIAVIKQVTNKNAPWLSMKSGGVAGNGYTVNCDTSQYTCVNDATDGTGDTAGYGYKTAPAPDTAWHILVANASNKLFTTTSRVFWLDGLPITTVTGGHGSFGPLANTLGGSGAVFSNCEIAFLAFSSTLTDADVKRVVRFLGTKYGVTVSC